MKIQILLTLLCCFTFLRCAFVESFTVPSFNTITARDYESKRCGANVCFGLEDSDMLQKGKFNLQKQIVQDIVLELTKVSHLQLSAVQYGITNTAISPLTYNVTEFLEKLKGASFIGSKKTAVGSPIVYCDAQLSEEFGPKTIVLLGRGRNNVGGDPIIRAELFRETSGKIIAVAVGNADKSVLTKIVGGNPSRVVQYSDEEKAVTKKVLPLLCPDI